MAKVWKVPSAPSALNNGKVNRFSLPLPKFENVARPFYTLFKRNHFTKRYVQVCETIYANERMAWLAFKNEIAESPLTYSIKMTTVKCDNAQSKLSRFPVYHWNPAREMLSKD